MANVYPKPYWDPSRAITHEKGQENPAYAHSKKDEESLLDKGYVDDYRNYPHAEYPRRLYNAAGVSVIVVDKKDEAAKTKAGFGRESVAPKEKTVVVAPAADSGRVDELEEKIARLELLIEGLTAPGKEAE